MIVEPKRPWKNYRRIQDVPTNKEYQLTFSAWVVIGAIVLCGIIIAGSVFHG